MQGPNLLAVLVHCSILAELHASARIISPSFFKQAFKKYEILTRKREAEILHEKETKSLESLDGGKEPAVAEPEIHIQDELPVTLPASASQPMPPKPQQVDRKDAPVLSKEKVEDWEKVSDIFNGAEMENYKWSQSINDIDVRVPVPEGTKAKDVKVDIRSDHLKVALLRPTPKVWWYIGIVVQNLSIQGTWYYNVYYLNPKLCTVDPRLSGTFLIQWTSGPRLAWEINDIHYISGVQSLADFPLIQWTQVSASIPDDRGSTETSWGLGSVYNPLGNHVTFVPCSCSVSDPLVE